MSDLPVAEGGGGTDPPFRRIAVIGFGLIGASLALAVRRLWPSVLLVAVDRRGVIERAMRMHAADAGGDDLALAAGAELVVLAAPVLANIEILGTLAAHIPGDAVVTDVGSTKRDIVFAARGLPDRLRFVGGHPLAGAAVGGVEASRADLFQGRPWILTPDGDAAAAAGSRLSVLLAAIGSHVQTMPPDAHDALVAYLSHLPQLAASALMHVVGEHAGAEGLALAGRGLRDTTRLASSPADIWRDIAASNQDNIARAIDELVAILLRMKPVPDAPPEALDRTFDSAAQWKRVLDRAAGPS
ncbi:MAG: prephenate dehydrogenase/arogenate dehydrogenase family protein [Acidobacteriota bacterium]|nr:prephenate dehydrogenase/arogenate dehydrogenase family protein [Acidobacteriota bacterium]